MNDTMQINPYAPPKARVDDDVQQPSSGTSLPLFPVTTQKFVVLTLCTFGLYELYWSYQNWARLRAATQESISPFWRAFFAPLWGFSLFGRIHDLAATHNIPTRWSHWVMASAYLVLSVAWRLPDPWWWISIASVLPMIPVQRTAQRINDFHSSPDSESRNGRDTILNIMAIVFGGLLLILGVIGTFLPE